MQTVTRLFAEFVARTLGQKAPTTAVTVDTSASDQAWWEEQVALCEEEHYQKLGDWYCEEVSSVCSSCKTTFQMKRWEQSADGDDECEKCALVEYEQYQDFLAAIEANR